MWRWELQKRRNEIYLGRGGPVRLRIEAIKEIDDAMEYLEKMEREGRLSPDAVWGAFKN